MNTKDQPVQASGDSEEAVWPLPCPFCGYPPAVEVTGFHGGARKILCKEVMCMQPHVMAETEDEAVKRWNTRATPDRAAVVEALAKAVDAKIEEYHTDYAKAENDAALSHRGREDALNWISAKIATARQIADLIRSALATMSKAPQAGGERL